MPKRSLILIALFVLLFILLNSATDETDDNSLAGSRVNQEFDYFMTGVDSTFPGTDKHGDSTAGLLCR
jgi:hypothetical protein